MIDFSDNAGPSSAADSQPPSPSVTAAPDAPPQAPVEQPIIAKIVLDNLDETVQRLVATEKLYREAPERKKKEEEWKAAIYAYKGFKIQGQQWCIREIFRQVETLIPKLSGVLLSGDELFQFIARQEGFDGAAEGATAIAHDQIFRFGSIRELHMFIRDFVIMGTVFCLPGWRKFHRTSNAPKTTPMHAKNEDDEWERKTTEVIEEAPFLEYVFPGDVYQHPLVEDVKNSPAVFIIKHVSVDDLKTMIREGYLDKDATEQGIEESAGGYHDDAGQFTNLIWKNNRVLENEGQAVYKLSMCWTSDGYHYVVLNDKTLLRGQISDDGKIPLIQASNYGQSREAWGTGEPITIIDDQRLLNEVTDLWVKQNWYGLPMWLIPDADRNNFLKSTFKPGGHVVSNDPSKIGLLPQGRGGTMDLANSMSFIIERQKLTSGLSNVASGTSAGETKTATGLVTLNNNSDERVKHKVSAMLIPAFKEMYQAIYNLNAKFLNKEYSLRITGKDGVREEKKYGPSVFAPDIDVQCEIGGGAGPEQQNSAFNAYKLMGQDPLVNRGEIIKEAIKSLGWARPKRFMANPANAQADALEEGMVLLTTGIINEPKPGEDSVTHLKIHQMQLSSPEFMANPASAKLQNHLVITMQAVQAMQQAQQEAQQQSMLQQGGGQGPGGGATPVQQGANNRANSMFGMGDRGAMQMGVGR